MQSVPASRCGPGFRPSFAIRALVQFKQHPRLPILRSASLFAITSAIACQVIAAKPVVYDTGYEIIHRTLTPSLYWIDNDRLLFEGANTSDMNEAVAVKDPHRVERLKKLYVWDAKSQSVRFYAEGSRLCVSKGTLHYTVRTDKSAGIRVKKIGPLGSEKEITEPLPTKEELSPRGQMARVHEGITCKTHLRSELSPPAPQRRRIIVLREGDGYLDAGPNGTLELIDEIRATGPGHIKLFQPGNPTPIELPITLEQGPGRPAYSEYLGAYFTLPNAKGSNPGLATDWPKGVPFTIYVLSPTGRTSEFDIPYDGLVNIFAVEPTKRGWLFGGGNIYRSLGLYLFDRGELRKLDIGSVSEIAVSQDGCLAGVGIQYVHRDKRIPRVLRIFNICEGGR